MARGKAAFFGDDDFDFTTETVQEEAPAAIAEPAAPVEDLTQYASPVGTQGRKGQKSPRMNLAIPEDVYDYIRRESRREGMTYSEYICAVMRQRRDNRK